MEPDSASEAEWSFLIMETSLWRGRKNHSDSTDFTVTVLRIFYGIRDMENDRDQRKPWLYVPEMCWCTNSKNDNRRASMEYKKNTILIELIN